MNPSMMNIRHSGNVNFVLNQFDVCAPLDQGERSIAASSTREG
jgi:hypothetical protein